MSRKVFTAGEVLAAADVNSFLMDQTVMSFAGTAARGSAIPSPVNGMTTYLEDTKDLRIYDGSAWQSPFGSTLIAKQSFSGVSTVSFNNIFTAQYQNYEIYASYRGTVRTQYVFRFRASGSDNSTSNYNHSTTIGYNSTTIPTHTAGGSQFLMGTINTGDRRNFTKTTISNPGTTGLTKNYTYQAFDFDGNCQVFNGGGNFEGTGLFDGFSMFPSSGLATGEIYVYGMRV